MLISALAVRQGFLRFYFSVHIKQSSSVLQRAEKPKRASISGSRQLAQMYSVGEEKGTERNVENEEKRKE